MMSIYFRPKQLKRKIVNRKVDWQNRANIQVKGSPPVNDALHFLSKDMGYYEMDVIRFLILTEAEKRGWVFKPAEAEPTRGFEPL